MKRIVAVLCVVVLMLSLGACTSKTPKTAAEFTQIMESAGFTVTDESDSANGMEYYITSLHMAEGEDYDFEFCVFDDVESAEGLFKYLKENMDDKYPVGAITTSVSIGNYSYYTLSVDGNFYLLSRIDNTLLCCEAYEINKDEVVDHVEKLGYK